MSVADQVLVEKCGFMEKAWWAWDMFARDLSPFGHDEDGDAAAFFSYDEFYDEYQGDETSEWVVSPSCDGYMRPLFTGRLVYVKGCPVPKVHMLRQSQQYEVFDLMCPLLVPQGFFNSITYSPQLVDRNDVIPAWLPPHAEDAVKTAHIKHFVKILDRLPCNQQFLLATQLLRLTWPRSTFLRGAKEKLQGAILDMISVSKLTPTKHLIAT